MKNNAIDESRVDERRANRTASAELIKSGFIFLAALCFWIGATGCQTAPVATPNYSDLGPKGDPGTKAEPKSDILVLHEGDSVRITFPGAPNLNTVQLIRRDGRITLPLVGEFRASGLTPPEMEKKLIEVYGPQLQSKEVSVGVESSAFVVYVTGAVLRPGRIQADRPISILTAAMEAGGFDHTRANLKAVQVIRTENEKTEHFKVNVKRLLDGREDQPFPLKPGDIVYVPERFTWF